MAKKTPPPPPPKPKPSPSPPPPKPSPSPPPPKGSPTPPPPTGSPDVIPPSQPSETPITIPPHVHPELTPPPSSTPTTPTTPASPPPLKGSPGPSPEKNPPPRGPKPKLPPAPPSSSPPVTPPPASTQQRPPPPQGSGATDLELWLKKVADTRGINANERATLRKAGHDRANAKGEFGAQDRKFLNNLYNEIVNRPPPSGPQGPPTGPPSGPPPNDNLSDALKRWSAYDKAWSNLSDSDKKFIKSIFPTPQNKQAFLNLNEPKQDALVDTTKDKKLTDKEKKRLKRVFGVEDPDTDPDDDPDDNPNNDDDSPGGDDPDNEPDDDTSNDTPVNRGGKDNSIRVPPASKRTNYPVTDDSDERISMPDISKKVTKEIEKLTSELIDTTKEFVEAGWKFYSIDYFPEQEIITDEGESYFPLPDYNQPPPGETGLARERIETIKDLINQLLSRADPRPENDYYNYDGFVNLFTLKYDGDGKPYFRFSIELTGVIIDDLEVNLVEEENDKD